MNRASLKSAYCTRNASTAFDDLIQKIRFFRILSAKGRVDVFSKAQRAFSADKFSNRKITAAGLTTTNILC